MNDDKWRSGGGERLGGLQYGVFLAPLQVCVGNAESVLVRRTDDAIMIRRG
jgi:hypothetical protein